MAFDKTYQIKDKTVYIMHVHSGEYRSKILEETGEIFYDRLCPRKLIEVNCLQNGSNIQGRTSSIIFTLNKNSYLLPILISEKNMIIMQPNKCHRSDDCIYVNLMMMVEEPGKCEFSKNDVKFTFTNGESAILPIRKSVVERNFGKIMTAINRFN